MESVETRDLEMWNREKGEICEKVVIGGKERKTIYLPKESGILKNFNVTFIETAFPGQLYIEAGLSGTSKYLKNQRLCPDCGSREVECRGSETRLVRDIPYQGRPPVWRLTLPEFRCMDCGRESFLLDLPELFRRGSSMTFRLEEFIFLLATCTSCEGAAKILQCMNTDISGDTVMRMMQEYSDSEAIQRLARWLRENNRRKCRKITEEYAQKLANDLMYYMEPEILSLTQETRLNAMRNLFELVFVRRKASPGSMPQQDKKSVRDLHIWKEE